MAYDEDLADRLREALATIDAITERKMFGGLAFLVNGNMAVAAGSDGGLMVRVDRAEWDDLLATTGAQEVVMRGRPMRGWLRVAAADLGTTPQLQVWVDRGVGYASSLPSKSAARS